MGKASRAKRDGTRQQRIAAQQAAARRAEIRNRVLIFSGIAVVVIAVVLWLLNVFGLFHSLSSIHIGKG